CPYMCTYCSKSVFGNKLRVRDPVRFVDEIEYLHRHYNIKEFQIADDNFSFYYDHAMKICKEILKRNLKISWTLPNGVRADRMDSELLKQMKQSGCYYMAFGFEFGSSRILKIVKKSLDSEKAKQTVHTANKLGFITHGFFLMGHPEETLDDLILTQKLAISLPLDRISIGIPIPYPGSELFQYYLGEKNNNLLDFDWNYYKEGHSRLILKHLDLDALRKIIKQTTYRFYGNIHRILNFARKINNINLVGSILDGVFATVKIMLRTTGYSKLN
ncbi:unnamed protein product, partial [marine sediment metagenome]